MGHAVSGASNAVVSQDYTPVQQTPDQVGRGDCGAAGGGCGSAGGASGAGGCGSKSSSADKQAIQDMLAKALLQQAQKDDEEKKQASGNTGIQGTNSVMPQMSAVSFA